ncbi:Predicted Zn-dependent peptidase [Arachidicoccus rhizosphaerae]|uniref:Predicted Zn-dependent peptidase n=1 Tax=Arachidicoccus rhizosphaerae TaxID=551991 RepID=A0A1H4B9K4_9BACT|nr:pitrilysin family protein [Arachidicoccus rhizosphaerae]SEA44821.1 Predicted Zn-dependent peptidase [Arachidicoccus rhizosphaerae]
MLLRSKSSLLIAGALLLSMATSAQKVNFTEYDLDNGLHVILHQDNKAPVVAVSVMYHVGSKNETPGLTGFAHFFEHLLFEGSQNIKRGEFMKIVSAGGGTNNANTTQDRTYYYEVFPSNQLKLGLWLESERMMHPVINQVGVNTQREVVKEEKRMRVDNRPYGHLMEAVFTNLFVKHPYHWQPIGSMDDINRAKLSQFQDFFKKFYIPGNAVLSISGDLNLDSTKKLIAEYFGPIPGGPKVIQPDVKEDPITQQIIDTAYDPNIQVPAILTGYRTPPENSKDAVVLEMISSILSGGASSRLYKELVDDKKTALQVASFNYALEDYGAYLILGIPNGNTPLDSLLQAFNENIKDLQTNLISEQDYKKILNQAEMAFVDKSNSSLGVAEELADSYTFYNKNTNHINEELQEIRSVTREQIRDVARKYLNPNQRLVLYYLPKAK